MHEWSCYGNYVILRPVYLLNSHSSMEAWYSLKQSYKRQYKIKVESGNAKVQLIITVTFHSAPHSQLQ